MLHTDHEHSGAVPARQFSDAAFTCREQEDLVNRTFRQPYRNIVKRWQRPNNLSHKTIWNVAVQLSCWLRRLNSRPEVTVARGPQLTVRTDTKSATSSDPTRAEIAN